MATTRPSSGPDLVRDAHYHPLALSAKWKAFVEGIQPAIVDSLAQRQHEDRDEHRATTYARGILGEH